MYGLCVFVVFCILLYITRNNRFYYVEGVVKMDIVDKIVDFEHYCSSCKSSDIPQDDEPCNECLSQPVNTNSCKPVCYEEK